jgi:hypothetical protein
MSCLQCPVRTRTRVGAHIPRARARGRQVFREMLVAVAFAVGRRGSCGEGVGV